MATSPVEEIKQRIDIVDFLRGYLELNPAGRNFKALCPFHNEKSPSFMISPDRQSWRCFGCGLSGDAFSFLMQHEHIDFSDALRLLAEKTGVELKKISPGEYKEQNALYEVVAEARNWFMAQLKESDEAKEYLKKRGLNGETALTFELGWAPQGREFLTQYLLKKGYAPDLLLKSGLSLRTQSGLLNDRFRGRIMFPLHNHLGKVVGFTGRLLPQYDTGEMGKYVNTPETPIFSKSRLLYGFHKSKQHVGDTKELILVEGQMDFLALWQEGFRNVAASSGTALTLDHLKLIGRLTDKMILTFDTDEAGQAAGERAIDLASQNDFNVKVVVLPPEVGEDPAEAALKNPEKLRDSLQSGVPAMRFYFDRHLPQTSSGGTTEALPELKKNLRLILQKLQGLSSPVERDFWLKELSQLTGVSMNTLLDEARQNVQSTPAKNFSNNEVEAETSRPMTRRELILMHLFSLALSGKKISEVKTHLEYATPAYQEIYQHIEAGRATSPEPDLDEILQAIFLRADRDFEEEEFRLLLTQLKEEYLKERRRELTQRIQNAERDGNDEELAKAMAELNASYN